MMARLSHAHPRFLVFEHGFFARPAGFQPGVRERVEVRWESARGLAHSKTLTRMAVARVCAKRLGVRAALRRFGVGGTGQSEGGWVGIGNGSCDGLFGSLRRKFFSLQSA